MLHQLLEGPEGGSPGYEEAALVELPDPVVLHRVPVPHRKGEVVPPVDKKLYLHFTFRYRIVHIPALGVPDEEGAVLILHQQQLLLGLDPLDLAEVPGLGLDALELGHVVAGDVALLLGGLASGEPPVTLQGNVKTEKHQL